MATQKDLIGEHPTSPNFFSTWLKCNDIAVTVTKNHRSLSPLIPSNDANLIDWLGRKLFEHHHNEYRIQKLMENYGKLGFAKYAESNKKLPTSDRTKKGNATEIILTEYIESCLQKKLIKVFKLKYNPNVDQAMKGDDTLMVDIIKQKKIDRVKVYLGEAKFRKAPSKTVINSLASALSKDKRPLSYSFLIDDLGRNSATKNLADILDKFIIEEIKGKGDLIYTGLLISNMDTFSKVESHLKSDNPSMILISIGIENPEELMNKAFEKAEYYVQNPYKL